MWPRMVCCHVYECAESGNGSAKRDRSRRAPKRRWNRYPEAAQYPNRPNVNIPNIPKRPLESISHKIKLQSLSKRPQYPTRLSGGRESVASFRVAPVCARVRSAAVAPYTSEVVTGAVRGRDAVVRGGRGQLLRYFGEEFDGCGQCDVCAGGPRAERDCWWEGGAAAAAVEGNGKGLGRKDSAWWAGLEAAWTDAAAALAGVGAGEAGGGRDKSFWRGLIRYVTMKGDAEERR